jgi:hypothetical protein
VTEATQPPGAPAPPAARDTLGTALLIGGIAVALLVAFATPALHFRGADQALLGLSAWEAVPWLTKAKVAVLGLAAAAAFLPRLRPMRLPITAAACVMMFLPAVGALAAAVYQWSEVRAEIVQIAGTRTPWIDPGWGVVALVAAALMLVGSLWRAGRAEGTPAPA